MALVSLIILFWLTKPQISLSTSHYIIWSFMTGCFFLKYIEVDLKAKSKLDSLHSCLCAVNCTGFLPPCLQHFPKCLNVTHPETSKLVMSLSKSVSIKCESLWHSGDCIPPAWRPMARRHSLSALGQKKTFKAWRKKNVKNVATAAHSAPAPHTYWATGCVWCVAQKEQSELWYPSLEASI